MPGIDDVNHALATARRLADAAGSRRGAQPLERWACRHALAHLDMAAAWLAPVLESRKGMRVRVRT
jgi:hypothetical protein